MPEHLPSSVTSQTSDSMSVQPHTELVLIPQAVRDDIEEFGVNDVTRSAGFEIIIQCRLDASLFQQTKQGASQVPPHCPPPFASCSNNLIPANRASGIALTYFACVTAIVLCLRSSFAARASPVN